MPLTLAQARSHFSRYVGEGDSFTDRLNMILERLLPEANGKETRVPLGFVVYEDRYGNQTVTLPRDMDTILAGAYQARDPNSVANGRFWCGKPLAIRNDWYTFSPSGPGNIKGSSAEMGIVPLAGRYTTFADWDEPMTLRLKLEKDEAPGGFVLFKGFSAGAKIYTTDGDSQIEGVKLEYSTGTVDTTQTFDEPPYQIVKPITKGRMKLYAVNEDGDETIVGWYEPDETNPSYARWKVPVCDTDV